MAPLIPKVAPGELITAQLMNKIIDAWSELDRRVLALEGSGAVQITQISPVGSLRMRSEVQVSGRNFGLPSQVTVSLNGTKAILKAGSGDRLLIFDVPVFGGVDEAGIEATLLVQAAAGSTAEQVRVQPPLPLPNGDIVVSVKMPNVPTIDPGIQKFPCSINVRSSEYESFSVTARAGTAQQPWAVSVLDADARLLSELAFPKSTTGTTKPVTLQVTIPPGTTGAAALSLTVTAKRNPAFTGTSGDIGFRVGEKPPSQPTIPVTARFYDMGTGAEISPASDTKLHLRVGSQYFVELRFTAPTGGTYPVSARAIDRPDLWSFAPGFGASVTATRPQELLLDGTITVGNSAPDTSFEVDVQLTGDSSQFGHYSQKITIGRPTGNLA